MSKSFLLTLVLLLGGCSYTTAPLPVINKSPDRVIPETYRVQKGDSIYTIAWKYGVDFEDVVKLNRLKEPYKLQQDQIVKLRKNTARTAPSTVAVSEIKINQPIKTTPTTASIQQPAQQKKVAGAVGTATASNNTAPVRWYWPAQGELTRKFSVAKSINGIQISGKSGSPISATAAGEVVYVGEGLRGYGKLIILKHSDKFLSAYAHNKNILVREGDWVAAKQQIATMGNSGAQSTMLHFEIRKQGNPTDPLKYLQKNT